MSGIESDGTSPIGKIGPNPQPKPKPVSVDRPASDDLSAAVADIGAALDQNERVSPVSSGVSKPKPGAGWKREPLSNFALDDDGRVITRSNGSPVRRGGKPAKAKTGDKLADGTVSGVDAGAGAERVGVSRVVIPPESADDPGAGAGAGDPGAGGRSVQAGPEFGRTLAKTGFNVATKRGGDRWKPTSDESELIENSAGQVFAGRRVPWLLALAVGIVGYMVARVEFKKTGAAEHVDNASVRDRADPKRQDVVSQAAVRGVGPF